MTGVAECPAKAGTSGTPFIEGGDLYAERAGYRMSGAGMGPEFREWRIIW
ncbi:hypothetical protein CLOSYM_03618 [[Clostridium] symbiosum ATCC 14940]|uniref:Uncharacterized protein n=1 Tax=[Clostridium] symbiosum ATCC 14940 TaxID=411472 RepID=A0ABC9TUB6_CLOSY|nr:hypothetical protein CLOSYM_03618 [[Clostridium] symbiosum ATCC 14940]